MCARYCNRKPTCSQLKSSALDQNGSREQQAHVHTYVHCSEPEKCAWEVMHKALRCITLQSKQRSEDKRAFQCAAAAWAGKSFLEDLDKYYTISSSGRISAPLFDLCSSLTFTSLLTKHGEAVLQHFLGSRDHNQRQIAVVFFSSAALQISGALPRHIKRFTETFSTWCEITLAVFHLKLLIFLRQHKESLEISSEHGEL